jgi:hypothetical protein
MSQITPDESISQSYMDIDQDDENEMAEISSITPSSAANPGSMSRSLSQRSFPLPALGSVFIVYDTANALEAKEKYLKVL